MAPSRSVELVGRVLGDRYRLTRPVGTGASAHVYAADDPVLRRRVAVKVLHAGLADDDAFTRRFQAEAQAAAALHHPHVLEVYDWGEDAGTPYLVMALLEGGSLRSMVERGQLLTPAQAARVGADVARALDHAHRHGVIHRDIKPANLIFDEEGRATVADFGMARALAAAAWTEPIGGILGTARYASPEQVRSESVDGRADVYALALVLVEAVTGTVPFASDDPVGTVMARLDRPIDPGASMGPLAEVVAAAGTVGRDARLDAAGMALALEAAALRLPPPGPLPLVGLLGRSEVERDDAPTEVPGGRATPFDIDAVDRLPGGGGGGGGWNTGQPAPPAPLAAPPALTPASPPDPSTRRRRRWPWLVAAVALLGAGGAGVATYLATRPTPTRAVPAVTRLSQAQASAALAPLHLRLAVVARAYSATVPAGEVISQAPAGGRAQEGSAVSVALSLGPQPIRVPALAGRTEPDAATVLTTLGLRVGTLTHASSLTVPAGALISSSPAAGTLLPGQAVALTVSDGKPFVTVPATTASFAAAQAALTGLGLPSSETEAYSDTVPQGEVISYAPGAGSSLRVGTAVTVEVSRGPHLVTVPSVQALSVTSATQDLTNAGLVVAGVTGNPTATVTATSPGAGSVVHWQSQVTIITG